MLKLFSQSLSPSETSAFLFLLPALTSLFLNPMLVVAAPVLFYYYYYTKFDWYVSFLYSSSRVPFSIILRISTISSFALSLSVGLINYAPRLFRKKVFLTFTGRLFVSWNPYSSSSVISSNSSISPSLCLI